MKIDVYTLLPDRVKDYIAEEISEALAKNNIDNSSISWDIDCDVLNDQVGTVVVPGTVLLIAACPIGTTVFGAEPSAISEKSDK